jgi:two-component system NtrC family sensor kinase
MPALRSSVLIIAHPDTSKIEFGADFAKATDAAEKMLKDFKYPVIVVPSEKTSAAKALALLEFVNLASPLSQKVIIQNDTNAEDLRKMINTGSVFRILASYDDAKFEITIREALEEYSLLQQNAKLLQLVNEQNERLKKLTADLEERVEARKKSLEEAKAKLLVTNDRVEALHRALVAIHRAGSIPEMERLVNEALSGALGLNWIRILFQSQARLESQGKRGLGESLASQKLSVHVAPLTRGKETLGHIHFARPSERPFTRDETSFLGQTAEAVSFAIDRLTKLDQSETLKHQWEATFDAIAEPVSMITPDLTVIRINRSFAERSGIAVEKIIGMKCYEALFGRTTPCDGCMVAARAEDAPSGANFRLKPSRTPSGVTAIYDVFSQRIEPPIRLRPGDDTLFVNMYHDISAQLRLERQILESAKMAELGTIGSSIAHELNNPLGGMLSFLQLIKMDLKGHEPYYDDIIEMEKGARRCRDIVQSLLGFTRKSNSDTVEFVDLREVVEQALKITELQTRSVGVTVAQDFPEHLHEVPVQIRGQFNALAQAIRGFLQNAQEAITERLRSGDKTPGEIQVKVSENSDSFVIEIKDNGFGFDAQVAEQIYDPLYTTKDPSLNPGLGLTLGKQIISDHGGRLEIRSTKGLGTSAIISLPRPVFDP